MSYLRKRTEEKTGYQESAAFFSKIDLGCDFVMAYGCNDTMPERVAEYRQKGYVVHLMCGIAWGGYQDYLNGKWDGLDHWDEAQTDRYGNRIMHGETTPYMVPSVAFADYLTEKLKAAVDAGVEAIHVEEPEFWDRGGYSAAFQREYELYYRQPWQPPHLSLDAMYKAAKLKAYLYQRTIDRISAALKEYAYSKYNRVLRFYVPTHSLLNYTQWKIVSPEGKLADIAGVDGFIAQVWTGTSREKNWFDGVLAERTFETAYLEYGVMQELASGTGKKMWFLHDPIEDNPQYDWSDYRFNYLETLIASLLHPKISSYEICPWPRRVFNGKYPSGAPDAQPISKDYCTLLNNVFQLLGDIETAEPTEQLRVGVLMSDTALYQRNYPDNLFDEKAQEKVGTVLHESDEENERFCSELFENDEPNRSLLLKFNSSNALPLFYGLAMPLVKYGVPLRPVLLDNLRRYNGYLDGFNLLVLSYEFMKPEYPDVNNALAAWVRNGGQLLYVGDGSDPYNGIESWWSGSFSTPADHLFEMLGISPTGGVEHFFVGNGTVTVWQKNPAEICYSKANADEYREIFLSALKQKGHKINFTNRLIQKRGSYIVAAMLDESVHDGALVFTGSFADMLTPDFKIISHKALRPGENALLFDLSTLVSEVCIIGTSVRINELTEKDGEISLSIHGADNLNAYIRLKTPFIINFASCDFEYDQATETVLLNFVSSGDDKTIILKK